MDPQSRDYQRVRRKLVASVRERHVDTARIRQIEAAISDLGEGGMFIEMPNPPSKGTILDIEFDLPGRSGRKRILGIVRWRETAGPRAGVGVRFAPIGRSEHADIQELVQTDQVELRLEADDLRQALGGIPGADPGEEPPGQAP